MYGIEIRYSWGDCEDGLYGNYKTKEEAYKDMCMLAAKEAYVQNEEFLEEATCVVYFDAAEFTIDLHYDSDDQWCLYRIKKHKNRRNDMDKIEFTKETVLQYLKDVEQKYNRKYVENYNNIMKGIDVDKSVEKTRMFNDMKTAIQLLIIDFEEDF